MKIYPNYKDLGFSDHMGPKLKQVVEIQLSEDLKHYCKVDNLILKYDWSESCIEGRHSYYLDGLVDRFSSIFVFDNADNLIADGWMEFIHEDNFFLAYWDTITIYKDNIEIFEKEFGMPYHIWGKIPYKYKLRIIKKREQINQKEIIEHLTNSFKKNFTESHFYKILTKLNKVLIKKELKIPIK